MYQDVPLYTLEEYKHSAPEEMRTEQILGDEHQLMLSRLNFELTERQRCALPLFNYAPHYHMANCASYAAVWTSAGKN
jgi:hypothetical protein